MTLQNDTVTEVVSVAPVDPDCMSTPTFSVPRTNPAPEADKATDLVLPYEGALRFALHESRSEPRPPARHGR